MTGISAARGAPAVGRALRQGVKGSGMLGFFVPLGRGEGDAILGQVVAALAGQGIRLAGVVQRNPDHPRPGRPCHMDLHILGQAETVRISQERGPLARGCRLDSQGLAHAVGRVEAALKAGEADLLVINKFGKQEAEGAGFRDLVGLAISGGIPVLTSVRRGQLAEFRAYAQGLETQLPAETEAVCRWALAACRSPADPAA